jgi:hypothetical protein
MVLKYSDVQHGPEGLKIVLAFYVGSKEVTTFVFS